MIIYDFLSSALLASSCSRILCNLALTDHEPVSCLSPNWCNLQPSLSFANLLFVVIHFSWSCQNDASLARLSNVSLMTSLALAVIPLRMFMGMRSGLTFLSPKVVHSNVHSLMACPADDTSGNVNTWKSSFSENMGFLDQSLQSKIVVEVQLLFFIRLIIITAKLFLW